MNMCEPAQIERDATTLNTHNIHSTAKCQRLKFKQHRALERVVQRVCTLYVACTHVFNILNRIDLSKWGKDTVCIISASRIQKS